MFCFVVYTVNIHAFTNQDKNRMKMRSNVCSGRNGAGASLFSSHDWERTKERTGFDVQWRCCAGLLGLHTELRRRKRPVRMDEWTISHAGLFTFYPEIIIYREVRLGRRTKQKRREEKKITKQTHKHTHPSNQASTHTHEWQRFASASV